MYGAEFGIIGSFFFSVFFFGGMIWLLWHMGEPRRIARDNRIACQRWLRDNPMPSTLELKRLAERDERREAERERRIILPGDPLWLASVSGRDPGDPPGGVPPPKPRTITIHISRS